MFSIIQTVDSQTVLYIYCVYVDRVPLAFVSNPSRDQAPSSSNTPCRQVKSLGNKMYNGCTVKVVRARKEICSGGKIEFFPYEATYLDLKPSTANACYIQSEVQKIWGADYVIVSNDGLEIVDTSATRGRSEFLALLCDLFVAECKNVICI